MTEKPANWPKGKKYTTIIADPPWLAKMWPAEFAKNNPGKVYPTVSLDYLKSLPVKDIVADKAILHLWVIDHHLPDAFSLMKAWGFDYVTRSFTWVKTKKGSFEAASGMGVWTRKATELCLMGKRGKFKEPLDRAIKEVIQEPRREHNRKPDCIFERAERTIAGPKLEMFARTARPGWDVWGNQTDHFK